MFCTNIDLHILLKNNAFYFLWRSNPARAKTTTFLHIPDRSKSQTHTPTHPVGLLWTDVQRFLHRLLPTQHTTNKTDKHRCPQRDSNRRSHQSSGFRPTPSTPWPAESASGGQSSNIVFFFSFYRVPLMWATMNSEDVKLSEKKSIRSFVTITA